jgi:hypothetical protein
MWRNHSCYFILMAAGLSLALAWGAWAAIPLMINHQGVVKVGGTNYAGTGLFRFAFVEGSGGTNLWTNDGSNLGVAVMPVNPVPLDVDQGLYSVPLGDVSIPGMVAVPSTVFNSEKVLLRIWFDDGAHGLEQLAPDQAVTSMAYAYKALYAEQAFTADQAENTNLIDGRDSTAFAEAAHDHPLYSLSGTLNDAQIPDDITVNHAATANDADTVDGSHAEAFMSALTDLWVNTTGDAMTGNLVVNGNVGLGVDPPLARLDVSGDAKVSGNLDIQGTVAATAYSFPAEQIQYFSVPSPAFVRGTSNMYCYIDNGSVSGSMAAAAVQVLAPINLPNGSRLVGYKVNCRDLDAMNNLTVRLIRQLDSGSASVVNSTMSTSGVPGHTTLVSPVLDLTIDNEQFAYLVQADWVTPATISDIKLFNVHVQYAVSGLRP